MAHAQNYSAATLTDHGVEIVRLSDSNSRVEVSIAPTIGNIAYDMRVNGTPVLWSPHPDVAAIRARPSLLGVPLMSPWANRLDQDAFWANGRRYALNTELKNFRRDQHQQPMHGLVSFTSDWHIVSKGADARSAWVTSRLEFWRHPGWMAQFPFAHNIEITYRLSEGVLEVHTRYENHSSEPMPLIVGYHPYFQLPGVPRDEWTLDIPAREHVTLSPKLIPTGERRPREQFQVPLRGIQLDDVFTGLERNANRLAEFRVSGLGKSVTVTFGPKYSTAVVYAPNGREFVCFEPMTGITNGANLAHEGKYGELQTVPARGVWGESFWIRAGGF